MRLRQSANVKIERAPEHPARAQFLPEARRQVDTSLSAHTTKVGPTPFKPPHS